MRIVAVSCQCVLFVVWGRGPHSAYSLPGLLGVALLQRRIDGCGMFLGCRCGSRAVHSNPDRLFIRDLLRAMLGLIDFEEMGREGFVVHQHCSPSAL